MVDLSRLYSPMVWVVFFWLLFLSDAILTPSKFAPVARSLRLDKTTGVELAVIVLLLPLSMAGYWLSYSESFWYALPGEMPLVLLETVFGVLPALLVLKLFHRPLSSVRLNANNWQFSLILGVLGALILWTPLSFYAPIFFLDLERMNSFVLLGTIYAALAEELFFRGLLQSRLERVVGNGWGILITALLFLFWHLPGQLLVLNLTFVGVLLWVIVTIPFALSLGFIAQRSNNLLGSTVLHVCFNLPIILVGTYGRYYS
jgi:membrane protease YdiL (CAAX protease family)